MEELKNLLRKQVEYLVRYGSLMEDISHTLKEIAPLLHDGFITLPYIYSSPRDIYIRVDKRLDLPRWFGLYFYGCREPVLKSFRLLSSLIELVFRCEDRSYDIHLRIEGEINLHDVISFAGFSDEVWDIILSEAKIYRDVARNLEMLYDVATAIREMIFSITSKPSIQHDTEQQIIDINMCSDEIAKLAMALKIVGDIQCECINDSYWRDVKHDLSVFPIRFFSENKIDKIYSYHIFNKPIDGKVPKWLSNIRNGYERNYRTLSRVYLENTNVIIWLEYENPDNNKDIESFYFVSSGKVSMDDLILASYVLDDEVWEWMLKEAMDYLVLTKEANIMIKDYVMTIARLTV
jgi:hypothetical protein